MNYQFWIFALLSILGTSTYYFGTVSKGNLKEVIQSIGGILAFGTLFVSFFILGWKSGLLLLVCQFTLVTFISALLVEAFTKKRIR